MQPILAIGAYKPNKLRIDGLDETAGVFSGADLLYRYESGMKPDVGSDVVAVGGASALDITSLCRRLKAKVTLITLFEPSDFKNFERDMKEASEEGVESSIYGYSKRACCGEWKTCWCEGAKNKGRRKKFKRYSY